MQRLRSSGWEPKPARQRPTLLERGLQALARWCLAAGKLLSGGAQPAHRRWRRPRRLGLEVLESRIALNGNSIVLEPGVLDSFTYTDPDGDVVVIEVQGTAGRATLLEAIGDGFGNDDGVLEDGEQLGEIRVEDASADFRIIVRSDLSNGVGNGQVLLGKLSALDQVFQGLAAGDGTPGEAQFELSSVALNSLSPGGEIRIGRITGDEQGAAILLNSLEANSAIRVADSLLGTVAVKTNWNGTIQAGGYWAGSIAIGGMLGATGQLIGGNAVVGDVAIDGNLNGTINIALRNYGRWTVLGSVANTARIIGAQHFNRLYKLGSFHGTMITTDSLGLDVVLGIGAAASFGSRAVYINSEGSIFGIIRSTALSHVLTDGSLAPTSRVYSVPCVPWPATVFPSCGEPCKAGGLSNGYISPRHTCPAPGLSRACRSRSAARVFTSCVPTWRLTWPAEPPFRSMPAT